MKKTAVTLLALGVTSVAFAAPTAENFYFGGKLGQSSYHKTVRLTNESDKTANAALHSNSGTAYGLYAGYRFNDWFSTELGWTKFADNKYTVKSGEKETAVLAHKANALDLTAKFNQFFSDKFNVYAGLGLSAVFNKLDKGLLTYGANTEKRLSKTTVAPALSAGLEYYFVDSFAVGVEYKTYLRSFSTSGRAKEGSYAVLAGSDAKSHTNRYNYRPNVQLFQATASYVFGQGKAPVVEAPVVTAEKFELDADVLFATNKYELSSQAEQAFSGVLAKYNAAKKVDGVRVEGYADRTGSEKYNLQLSQKRAQSVANYLVAQGVDASLVTATGLGETTAKSGGCYDVKNKQKLRECLAPDRRVDVTISGVLK